DKHLRSALDWFREQDDDYMVLRTGRSLVLCLIEQRRVQEAQELLIESLVLARKLGATTDAQELSRLGEALRAEKSCITRVFQAVCGLRCHSRLRATRRRKVRRWTLRSSRPLSTRMSPSLNWATPPI